MGTAFAIYWCVLLFISWWRGSMIEVDLGTSLIMLILAFLYWIAGGGLILAIENMYGIDRESREQDEIVPGKNTALHMVLLTVTQIFFRCVFWSVEDLAKLTYPESHNTAIPYWRLMWFIQQTFEIIGSLVIFGSVAMISRVETEVENSGESKALNEEF
jgi:NADH:ubiquinone oxidoreductase subunit 6 (subunit J)